MSPLINVWRPREERDGVGDTIAVRRFAGETFINVSANAPALRVIIDRYLRAAGLPLAAAHEVDILSMAISLVSSTRGVALLPAYAKNFLPASVTSRPLRGAAPTIDLVLGHHRDNASPWWRWSWRASTNSSRIAGRLCDNVSS